MSKTEGFVFYFIESIKIELSNEAVKVAMPEIEW